eukprot:5569312-Lingulodinium_polyedra.AAC.1
MWEQVKGRCRLEQPHRLQGQGCKQVQVQSPQRTPGRSIPPPARWVECQPMQRCRNRHQPESRVCEGLPACSS